MTATSSDQSSPRRAILVTGGGGYIGGLTVAQLACDADLRVIALDAREVPVERRAKGVEYITADIRDPQLVEICRQHAVDTIVHLACIVTPGKQRDRQLEYSVDVEGTENVLRACVEAGVRQIIVTSSGAAYGYHADNPLPVDEDAPLRGNEAFAYAHHKRLVEEMLARYRQDHPGLGQLVFRPGAVLGARTNNQITDLFHKRFLLGVAGGTTPWVFIWDEDVVACIVQGIQQRATGIYNLAGDGCMSLREIAGRLKKPYLPVPAWLLRGVLGLLRLVGATQYGPEQVDFLRYRPVLSNERLKSRFGYRPRKDSAQVLDHYLQHAQLAP